MIDLSEIKDLVQKRTYNISVGKNHKISPKTFTIFAGPCRVENYEQVYTIAKSVKKSGAHVFRAGVYKPCTHPHCNWGLADEGIEILGRMKQEINIPLIVEAMEVQQFSKLESIADILQIGTRNAQNYPLLHQARLSHKPVFYKRGTWMNLRETLAGLEWLVFNEEGNYGCEEVLLCERGTVHFNNHMRWTLDYTIVPSVKEYANIPVIIDISHGTGGKGNIKYYKDLARAAVAVGADGLMVEVHNDPRKSISDADQTMSLNEFKKLVDYILPIIKAVGREI